MRSAHPGRPFLPPLRFPVTTNEADTRIWTIQSVLLWATQDFKKRGLESPRLEAEILLSETLQLDRVRLILDAARPLLTEELNRYKELIVRRRRGEPLAYILGRREFYGLTFQVDPRVLIPRPDSEILVDVALRRTQARALFGRALDLCTGSGCIAVSFAKARPTWQVTGSDLSEDALRVAQKNALRLGTIWGLRWLQGDLFEPLTESERFEIITSNPPYIRREELAELPEDVRDYEPRLALDGGDSGLDFYRRLTSQALQFLVRGGVLAVEIGWDQAKDVSDLFQAAGFQEIEIDKDYGGRDRVVSGKAPRQAAT